MPCEADHGTMEDRIVALEQAWTVVQTDVAVIRENYVTKADLAQAKAEFYQALNAHSEKMHVALSEQSSKLQQAINEQTWKFHQEIHAQTWKVISWVTAICTGLTAAVYFIARNVH